MNMKERDRLSSIWQEGLPRFENLKHSKKVEVCIIGGGLAGLSCAYQLARRGHEVIVLEAFSLMSGQSGRTSAHLTSQLEMTFRDLLKIHDEEAISEFHRAHQQAIDTIEEIVRLENIACDFKRVDGYLFRGKNFDEADLQMEHEAAKRCEVNLSYVPMVPLLRQNVSGLKFSFQAQFDPMKYAKGLLLAMKDWDVSVYEGTHVTQILHPSPHSTIMKTDQGAQVEARYVVVATDSPISTRYAIHTKQYPYRTYALSFGVSSPGEEVLLWDTEDPYHFCRYVGNEFLVGGEDHHVGRSPERDPFETLELWARENFSFLNEVRSRWSGQVFEPADQLPFIGRAPGKEENIFMITGSSGLGMTTATIASEIIPSLIQGRSHAWEELFSPRRQMVKGVKDFVLENLQVAFQYKDWVTPAEVKSEVDIPTDSGKLLQEGAFKSCVYHGKGGHFEKKSAVCTHLGGIVHWNDIEKTWDCPCHGSRFNTKGQVIEGPAVHALEDR